MPITLTDNDLCCTQLMLGEAEAYGGVVPSLETRSAGALRALYSPTNGGPAMVIQDGKEKPEATSTRKAKIKFTTKECSVGELDAIDKCNLADAKADDPWQYADVEFAGRSTWGFSIEDADLRTMCENRVQFYNQVIANKLDAAIQDLNLKILEQLVPLMGKYPNGDESLVTPIAIPVVTPQGASNPTGMAIIKTLYNKMNQNGPVIHVGAGFMDLVANVAGHSGMNDQGINLGAISLSNFFRDANLANVAPLGGNDLLTWLAGSVKIAEYYQNLGDFEEYGSIITVGGVNWREYEYSVVELGGVKWDMFMKRDCGKWKFFFQKEFEVVPLPAEAFAACQDYNYAMRFLQSCDTLDCATLEGIC